MSSLQLTGPSFGAVRFHCSVLWYPPGVHNCSQTGSHFMISVRPYGCSCPVSVLFPPNSAFSVFYSECFASLPRDRVVCTAIFYKEQDQMARISELVCVYSICWSLCF